MEENVIDTRRKSNTSSDEFPTDLSEAAQRYARLGLQIFPLQRGSKIPFANSDGFKAATSDPIETLKRWSSHPHANIGIATGDLVAVDVDCGGGKHGKQSLLEVLGVSDPLSLTPLVQETANGGWHLVFRRNGMMIRNSTSEIAPNIDVRGVTREGEPAGYIVVAPSRLENGTVRSYRWLNPSALDNLSAIPEMPRRLAFLATFNKREREVIDDDSELKAKLDKAAPQEWLTIFEEHRPILTQGEGSRVPFRHPYIQAMVDRHREEIATAPPGCQNETLNKRAFSLGAQLKRFGLQEHANEVIDQAISAGLAMSNQRGERPWTERKVREHVERAVREGLTKGTLPPKDLKKDREQGQHQERCDIKGGPLAIAPLSSFPIQSIEFLWWPFIALGKLTLIAGEPGVAKSQVTMDVAARVTTGEEFPNFGFGRGSKREPGSVVLIAGEDDPNDTILPRLLAAGGDADRVHIIQGRKSALEDGTETIEPLSLQNAIGQLDDAIAQIGGVKLVIIDPISAYMGRADTHKNAEVRSVLAPLGALATKHGFAILIVTHLNKNSGKTGGNPLHRVTDSLGFTAAARSVLLVTKDASDTEDESKRLMISAKNNLAKDKGGMEFFVRDHVLKGGYPTSRVEWGRATSVSAGEALGGDQSEGAAALEDAKDFLRTQLSDGPQKDEDVKKAAKRDEISQATLRRAKRALNIKSQRKGGVGGAGWWEWSLPQEGGDAVDAEATKALTPSITPAMSTLDENTQEKREK